MPDKRIQTWQARGRRFVIDGRALFVVDTGGEDKPVLLILHGYPTSSHDYAGVLDTLASISGSSSITISALVCPTNRRNTHMRSSIRRMWPSRSGSTFT